MSTCTAGPGPAMCSRFATGSRPTRSRPTTCTTPRHSRPGCARSDGAISIRSRSRSRACATSRSGWSCTGASSRWSSCLCSRCTTPYFGTAGRRGRYPLGMRGFATTLAFVMACGGSGTPPGGDDGGNPPPPPGTLRDRQRQLAIDLRGTGDFMVGIGNDNSGPYDHQIPIDVHYAYLVGYGDQTGWPTWNANGDYPLFFAQTAEQHAATPMFTYYQLALELEQNNDAVLNDATRMHQYLSDVRLLFQRIADTGQPAAVQFEPDFFGYLMQRAAAGTPPDQLAAKTHFSDVPECSSLAE